VRLAAAPWSNLWQAYRAHALCLCGRTSEALEVCASFLPVDVYEWLHVFEVHLRCGGLGKLDLTATLDLGLQRAEHDWSRLAWQRMKIDYSRVCRVAPPSPEAPLREIVQAYDAAGLPWERCLARLSLARELAGSGRGAEGLELADAAASLARQSGFPVLLRDALAIQEELAQGLGQPRAAADAAREAQEIVESTGCRGPVRP
jgi:hypothetical protein